MNTRRVCASAVVAIPPKSNKKPPAIPASNRTFNPVNFIFLLLLPLSNMLHHSICAHLDDKFRLELAGWRGIFIQAGSLNPRKASIDIGAEKRTERRLYRHLTINGSLPRTSVKVPIDCLLPGRRIVSVSLLPLSVPDSSMGSPFPSSPWRSGPGRSCT